MQSLAIIKNLTPDYAALYKLSHTLKLSPELRRVLQTEVSNARHLLRRHSGADRLAEKLRRWGNNGDWAQTKLEQLARQIYNNKSPDNTDLGAWISVEIECIFLKKSDENSLVSFCRKNGYAKNVTVKNDGSVYPTENDGHGSDCQGCEESLDDADNCTCDRSRSAYGKELVVSFKFGDWSMLTAICQKLNSLGAYVNKTCGLHVHFDCRGLSSRQVSTMGKRIALTVPALKQLLPKSRQNNQYCADTINKMRSGSRYSFVNLHSFKKHQTLEVRGHSGTIDAEKIINWIRIIKKIMNTRNTKEVSHVSDLLTVFQFETDLMEYAMKRFSKFNRAKESSDTDDIVEDAVA